MYTVRLACRLSKDVNPGVIYKSIVGGLSAAEAMPKSLLTLGSTSYLGVNLNGNARLLGLQPTSGSSVVHVVGLQCKTSGP